MLCKRAGRLTWPEISSEQTAALEEERPDLGSRPPGTPHPLLYPGGLLSDKGTLAFRGRRKRNPKVMPEGDPTVSARKWATSARSLYSSHCLVYATATTQKRLCLRTLGRGNNWNEIGHEPQGWGDPAARDSCPRGNVGLHLHPEGMCPEKKPPDSTQPLSKGRPGCQLHSYTINTHVPRV